MFKRSHKLKKPRVHAVLHAVYNADSNQWTGTLEVGADSYSFTLPADGVHQLMGALDEAYREEIAERIQRGKAAIGAKKAL